MDTPPKQVLRAILDAALQAVDPAAAVRRQLSLSGDRPTVAGETFNLALFENVFILGAGKAAAVMASAVEGVLGDRIAAGAVNVKYGHGVPLRATQVAEAGHPVPDENGLKGARTIAALAARAGERDLVLCVLSGGASAIMPLPAEGVGLAEKQAVTRQLLACGATIGEMNAIRKHLSRVKGGGLARLAAPARLVTLILSDVVGDRLDVIASGPTVPDETTFADCLAIIDRHGLAAAAPDGVMARLRAGARGEIADTPTRGDPAFACTSNTIVANNWTAVRAAADKARELGWPPLILSTCIEGETREVARVHAAIVREILATGNPSKPPLCLISGGETTVTIQGHGKGGRNQEFALAAAIEIEGLENVALVSAGTDGTDGPTDAAGAFADGTTCARAREKGMAPLARLSDNDSYHFFAALGDLLVTGPTRTNVMDVHVALVGTRG